MNDDNDSNNGNNNKPKKHKSHAQVKEIMAIYNGHGTSPNENQSMITSIMVTQKCNRKGKNRHQNSKRIKAKRNRSKANQNSSCNENVKKQIIAIIMVKVMIENNHNNRKTILVMASGTKGKLKAVVTIIKITTIKKP